MTANDFTDPAVRRGSIWAITTHIDQIHSNTDYVQLNILDVLENEKLIFVEYLSDMNHHHHGDREWLSFDECKKYRYICTPKKDQD